jgi:hypothetical protein
MLFVGNSYGLLGQNGTSGSSYISHSDDFGKGSSLSITPLGGFTNKLS